VLGQTNPEAAGLEGPGNASLVRLLSLLDRFDFWFNIVTP